VENYEFDLAYELVENTGKSLFLTGKAGTGKTTFLKYVANKSKKKLIIVAPTGVAAINAGGVTIHSMFNLPLLSFIPSNDFVDPNIAINRNELIKHFHYSKEKLNVLVKLELMIIDEVSMVRADMLDAVDIALQFARRNKKPFGGVQVLFIGDMFQLPPVIKDETKEILDKYYKSPYFFDSLVLTENPPVSIELLKVYRQEDENFINILNKIRHQEYDKEAFDMLHLRYNPTFEPKENGYIYLTTHNATVDRINQTQLEKIKSRAYFFDAEISGDFRENMYPNDKRIILKVGAQVMFIRNDMGVSKKYFNGKMATVTYLTDDIIKVKFENESDDYIVGKVEWENKQYFVDKETNEIKDDVMGIFCQYPIRLAWAATIHKSQGLTFDKAIIDAGRSFAPGQVYVALSRCRTLEGITLKSRINQDVIFSDDAINSFQDELWNLSAIQEIIEKEKLPYSLEKIYKAINMQNLIYGFMEWNKVIAEKKIPDREKVFELCKNISDSLSELSDVEQKFVKRLKEMYDSHEKKEITWQQIEDRCVKGIEYFVKLLNEKVLFPFEQHGESIKKAKKIKGYLKIVTGLKAETTGKIKQLKELYLLEKKLYTSKPEDEQKNIVKTKEETEKEKLSTYDITFALLEEGKSIEEVAEERHMATGTIYSHVSKLILEEKIIAAKYIEQERLDTILNIIKQQEKPSLKAIKESLDETFSYGEINIASAEFYRTKS
jgi:hypothetical protein